MTASHIGCQKARLNEIYIRGYCFEYLLRDVYADSQKRRRRMEENTQRKEKYQHTQNTHKQKGLLFGIANSADWAFIPAPKGKQ